MKMSIKTNNRSQKMSECIFKKLKRTFKNMSLVLLGILTLLTISGCSKESESSDGSIPKKYFRYTKEGNVKDGEYIVIRGLNTKCDIQGNLEINLDDIWQKYQGILMIPEVIDGLPVKAVQFASPKGELLTGGIVSLGGKIQDPNSLYLSSSQKWLKLIVKLHLPDNVSFFQSSLQFPDLEELSLPSSCKVDLVNGCFDLKKLVFRDVAGKESVYGKYSVPFFNGMDKYGHVESITLPSSIKLINLAILFDAPLYPCPKTGVLEINCASDAEFIFYAYSDRLYAYAVYSKKVTKDPVEVLSSVHMSSRIESRVQSLEEQYKNYVLNNIGLRFKINGIETPELKSSIKVDNKTNNELRDEAIKLYESLGLKM